MPSSLLERIQREEGRVAALRDYALLEQPVDDELSAVVRVAAAVAGMPYATLNLIDEHWQCQLTTVGFEGGDSAREDSMCAVHFRDGRFVHTVDASEHADYATNPWVTGELGAVRGYASAALVTPEGYALGSLCVFDDKPRVLNPDQISRLLDLADVIVTLFERRRQARQFAAAARQHERSLKFIETVLETVDVGVAVCDENGQVTVVNRAARSLHRDVEPDPSIPQADLPEHYGLFDATGARPLEPDEIPLLRALRGETVHEAELVMKRPGAEPQHLRCNASRIMDESGRVTGAVVVTNNVTRDRMHRLDLEAAHREAAARGEQLVAAVIDLQRSNEELEQFAGAVSHDLVRPMAAAHGYLELLEANYAGALDERGTKWLDAAVRSVKRMQDLVQALLTYARAGQSPMRPSPVNLSEVLTDVLSDLRTIAESSRAEVTAPARLPEVLGDPTLIRQLLQNVIDNAMKYRSPDRPCRIAITAEREGERWTLSVADNGVGIPADQRDRVFEMFAQVDPAARKGHGIGLSTCLRIMERHYGAITLADTPGGGTTVRLTLPAPPHA